MWSPPFHHLYYDRPKLLANLVIDNRGQAKQRQKLNPGQIVFVKTKFLKIFLSRTKISCPITLITGSSDESPSLSNCQQITSNPYIISWFGTHIPVTHKKIMKFLIGTPMPINYNPKDIVKDSTAFNVKLIKTRPVLPFHSSTHKSRYQVWNIPLVQLASMKFSQYIQAINLFQFVICQRGKGMDTYRFCEVLLTQSVPIVLNSPLNDLYSQFPCIIVESYDDVPKAISTFVWNNAKYKVFLNMFWLTGKFKENIINRLRKMIFVLKENEV